MDDHLKVSVLIHARPFNPKHLTVCGPIM